MDEQLTAAGGRRAAMRFVLVGAAIVSLVATGCTMCPDPFDYAGPVPNGSVTQNDFAARSNGTRPVRGTPLPWPPIVDSTRRQPTPADEIDTTVLVAAEQPPQTDTDSRGGGASADGRHVAAVPANTAVDGEGPSPGVMDGAEDAAAVPQPTWRRATRPLLRR